MMFRQLLPLQLVFLWPIVTLPAQVTGDSTRRATTPPPAIVGAPRPNTTVDDLIDATRTALNDLKFVDAVELGHEALIQKRLRRGQRVLINQLLGAAFFPDPDESAALIRPDSARVYLRNAVRLQPDATLPEDIRWRGLDSLYQQVRATTFAAVAQPAGEYALTGVDGRAFVEVIAARPTHMWLQSVAKREGSIVVHDSVRGATRARLAMRAHDGTVPLFLSGDYELQVIVADAATTERDTLRYQAIAFGVPPVLESTPVLPSSSLKPERARKAVTAGIVAGTLAGAMTVALARNARDNTSIRSTIPNDTRATGIALLTLVGAITGGVFDRGRPLPANVRFNTTLRASHSQAVLAIETANRKKVGEYKVELRITGEAGR